MLALSHDIFEKIIKSRLTSKRKNEHISICLNKDVTFSKKNGFERYDFVHKALPELNLGEIDTSTGFMGKTFSYPFFIEALTGGSSEAGRINRNLARAAEQLGIGMGVGSQRAMLENSNLTQTYQVRSEAPSILLFGNIGATQLKDYSIQTLKKMVRIIGADGLAVHLNAAQEMCQPEGDTDWQGLLYMIAQVCAHSPFPVIVKETGCGIDGQTARQLTAAGVACIDVGGAGGTSFTKVENHRRVDSCNVFEEWGIPTADALKQCRTASDLPLIASGGIRSGIECAKAIAMGACLVGVGLPLLAEASRSSEDVIDYLLSRGEELRKTMLLIGVKDIESLKKVKLNHNICCCN